MKADIKHNSSRRLGLEIAVIVLVKLALLVIVWQLWFSNPVSHHMRVEPQRIAQQIVGHATATPPPITRANHDPP